MKKHKTRRYKNLNFKKGEEYLKERNYLPTFKCFIQGSQEGDYDSLHKLGVMYALGQGVKQSFAKAKEYFELASEQGCVTA
jgi:TPR repeat protein